MLFRKKREESHEENLLERPDGDNWRDYARMGDAKAEEGDIVSAVDYWSEAVDRFDDDRAKYLGRFCDTVVGKTVSCVVAMAENGEVPPTNLIGDVEMELWVKQPDADRGLTDEVYRGIAERIPDTESADELLMLYTAASYSVLGFMRYSPDVRHIKKRCADAADLGAAVTESALGMKRGRIKPKMAAKYACAFAGMFDAYAKTLGEAMEGMSSADLDRLAEGWGGDYPDRYSQIQESLQLTYRVALAGRFRKKSLRKKLLDAVEEYVAYCMENTDPKTA